MHIDISGLLKFADFFPDGFFSDYLVQERINDSLAEVRSKQTEVNDIISGLRARLEKGKIELENMEIERIQLIEQYGNL
ncbi:hypothetical protein [Oceanobacillus senegalensis]|uniref:hypothetical protein n=1 Tax=Oceanobacillus senegalensis TaxID=1936063 RepID=UPI000A3139E1|nr:hypothetical protein [Oceanobacillus senegalensis]